MIFWKCMPLLVVYSIFFVDVSLSSRILGYFTTPSLSHFIIHDSLMRGLAAKGHQVTVVSFFPPQGKTISNYTFIQLDMDTASGDLYKRITADRITEAENKATASVYNRMTTVAKTLNKINSASFTHPLVDKLRREETFDLVVFGWFLTDFQVGIAIQFNCPAVVICTVYGFKTIRDFVGNPSGLAHTPAAMTGFPTHMSYWQRVANFGIGILESVGMQIMDYFMFEPEYTANFPPDKHPSYSDAKKNVALVLTTTHFSQGPPMASFPAMIEVGGMHIKRTPDSLPTVIQEWLDNALDGAIYFSLGSNTKSTDLSDDKLNAILQVFGRLKQRVLWKFESDHLPGKPNNVMIQKWVPQDDVLAHPNVRLFISHCGKGGVDEARYHGVPILGIPVYADQPANMAVIVREGWGVPLQYSELTEATLEAALTEALTNPTYGEVANREAMLFRDRPQHPLDTAIFWVEYVIRHKGAKHMQSPAVHLTWYQYHSVDVIALYLFVIWVIFKITKCTLGFLYRVVFSSKKPKQE